MAREIIHKKLKAGTLVQLKKDDTIGIVTAHSWSRRAFEYMQDPHCYVVFVRGKEVREYREGLTVIGET